MKTRGAAGPSGRAPASGTRPGDQAGRGGAGSTAPPPTHSVATPRQYRAETPSTQRVPSPSGGGGSGAGGVAGFGMQHSLSPPQQGRAVSA